MRTIKSVLFPIFFILLTFGSFTVAYASDPEKVIGKIETKHNDGTTSTCTATLIRVKNRFYAITTASCVFRMGGPLGGSNISFIHNFRTKERVKATGLWLPAGWNDKKNNYAFVSLPGMSTSNFALLSRLAFHPKGALFTRSDIKKFGMLFGFYSFAAEKKYLDTILQNEYRLAFENRLIDGGDSFRKNRDQFLEHANKWIGMGAWRGSPLLYVNPPGGTPRVVGMMVDDGDVLAITEKMYEEFWKYTK